MRKMIVIAFIIMSALGFSETYRITPRQGVEVSGKELRNSSEEIGKVINQAKAKFSDNSVLDKLLSSHKGFEEASDRAFFEGMKHIAVKNMGIVIQDMEYMQEDKVNIRIKVRYSVIGDDEKIEKRSREIFKKMTGIDSEKMNEEQNRKYYVEGIKSSLMAYDEELSRLPHNMEKEITLTAWKEKGKWKIDPDTFLYKLVKLYE